MTAESSRDWFCAQTTLTGGASGPVGPTGGPNKIPVVTAVYVTVITAAAGNSISIEGTPSGQRAFQANVGSLNTYHMGRLYKGVRMAAGDEITGTFSGGAADVDVVVEGYYELVS